MASHPKVTKPLIKVVVEHGVSEYILTQKYASGNITLRENGINDASISFSDKANSLFLGQVTNDDIIRVYLNYKHVTPALGASDLRFHGFVEDPTIHFSKNGRFLGVASRAYSRCFADLLVNSQYGLDSLNPDISLVSEAIVSLTKGIIPKYINELMGLGDASGYDVDFDVEETTNDFRMAFLAFATGKISIDKLLDIEQALRGAANAGLHWIVKPSESGGVVTNEFLMTTIAGHTLPEGIEDKWAKYWSPATEGKTAQENSTITVEDDMIVQEIKRQRIRANMIVYSGQLLKPISGDFAENNSADWAASNAVVSDAVKNVNIYIALLGCVRDFVGVVTDQTAEANNATVDDTLLVPADPELGDAVYFGGYDPFNAVKIVLSTAATGTYHINWEYYNGTLWYALSGVTDGTGSSRTPLQPIL